MRQGTMVTHQSDFSYFGMKDEGNAQNHTVVAWSDNDVWDPGPDYMKFIFTSYLNQNGAAGTANGLEAARFVPDATGDEVYFGLGDWFNSGGLQPDERLDVLDRTVRIRDLPTNYEDVSKVMDKVVVVDSDGRLHWRPEGDYINAAATDCDWNQQVGGNVNLRTAYAGAPSGCPDEDSHVGVGVTNPMGKLSVFEDSPKPSAQEYGLVVHHFGDDEKNFGGYIKCADQASSSSVQPVAINNGDNVALRSEAWNATNRSIGVHGYARLASGYSGVENTGTLGEAFVYGELSGSAAGVKGKVTAASGSTVTSLYGVYGEANGPWDESNGLRCGVYGKASVGTGYSPGKPSWAGYFEGDVHITHELQVNTTWYTSDAALKDNVEDLQDGLDQLMQLQPRTYDFTASAPSSMGLPTGQQMGLIAQEVETVFPGLVKELIHPAELDSLGNVIEGPLYYKAVNYTGLIPVLIAALQDQQDRMDQLEADLASCCAHDGTGLDQRYGSLEGGGASHANSLENDRLNIAPNPFQERTTLSYLLDAPVRVRLQVHTESGMHLATLRDQPQEAGSYSMTWDTQDLAPGLYYVTLFADGKPVVKKAVKVR
ncbi:MAG: tail fiber domain-containing protein [Flavobacteriales bacterium]|nr:tail fiber domain-containing protein [Flavobacteriales bacterium]